MAVVDIIFNLSTKMGPGGLASLKAGIDMFLSLKNEVQSTVKELDEFKTVLGRVDMEMVNYADTAAKGQIDTLQLMKSLNALNESGVSPTEEQFKVLAVRATELSKATGQDATEAFKRLTDAIGKGQNRALAEYGIKLETSTDLQKTQTEALKAMTEGYEDLAVELETDTERMYALGNAWDTSMGLMWDAMTQGDSTLGQAISAITDNLNELNTFLSELDSGTKAYMFSVDGAIDTVKTSFAGLFEYMAKFHELLGSDTAAAGLRQYSKALLDQVKQARREAGAVQYDENYGPQQERPRYEAPTRGRRSGRRKEKKEDEPEFSTNIGAPVVNRGADYEAPEGDISDMSYRQMALNDRLVALDLQRNEAIRERQILIAEELTSFEEISFYNEQRLELLKDEEYQEAIKQEWREQEMVYEAEREIRTEFERERAIDFAYSFADAWRKSYKTIAAGATAVGHIQDLLKSSWSSLITSVIRGTGDWKAALKEVLIAKGIAIAIEEGWLGIQDTVAAVSAFARRQYSKGTKLLASAALHYALAGVAGAASGVASRIGGSGGGSVANTSSSYSSTPTFGGGGYSGSGESREVTYTIKLDDSASMFELIKEENTRQKISGGTSFNEDEAA